MRVNVYASECPQQFQRVEKTKDGRTLVGVRLFTDEDDPESAITFWGDSVTVLHAMLNGAVDALYRPEPFAPPAARGYGE